MEGAARRNFDAAGNTAQHPYQQAPISGLDWFIDTDRDHQREQGGRMRDRALYDIAQQEAAYRTGVEQRIRAVVPGLSDEAVRSFVDGEVAAARSWFDGATRNLAGGTQDSLRLYGQRVQHGLLWLAREQGRAQGATSGAETHQQHSPRRTRSSRDAADAGAEDEGEEDEGGEVENDEE